MEDKMISGALPLCLLPARNYAGLAHKENYVIKLPKKGSYHEIDPEFFPEGSGDFILYDDTHNVFHIAGITRVLLATKQYPDLGPTQTFIPVFIKVEENELVIAGKLVDMHAVENPKPVETGVAPETTEPPVEEN